MLNKKIKFQVTVLQQLFGVDNQVTELGPVRFYGVNSLRKIRVKPEKSLLVYIYTFIAYLATVFA